MFIILGSSATHDQLHVFAAGCVEHFILDILDLVLVCIVRQEPMHRSVETYLKSLFDHEDLSITGMF